MRRPATDATRRVGTLLVVPAGSGSNLVPLLGLILPPGLLDRFDVVLFDPPGIRSAPPLDCGEIYWKWLFDIPVTPWGSTYEQVARNCVSDPIFDSIDSEQLAVVLSQLVSSLGDEKVSVLTLWWTSKAAAHFAAEHPEQVSAVVYDSPSVEPEDAATSALDYGVQLEQELDALFARCEARGSTCAMGTEPAATWDRLVAQIAEQSALERTEPAVLSLIQLQMAALMALMFPVIFEEPLEQGIVDAIGGDATSLLTMVDDFTNRLVDEGPTSFIWNWALRCHDAVPNASLPGEWENATFVLAHDFPRMGGLAANSYIWACMLGIDGRSIRLPTWTSETAASAPPMLVLASEHDVATPAHWSAWFTAMIPGAVEATRAGLGSTWSFNRNACTDFILTQFLVSHATPAEPSICDQP